MKSDERSSAAAIDLDRDLPTTIEDVAALRRASRVAPLDLEEYLRFLAELPEPGILGRAPRRQVGAARPFELP